MGLRPTLTTEEFNKLAKPEQFAYVERDGKYVVNLDGAPSGFVSIEKHEAVVKKLDEFRNTGRGQHTKISELEARLSAFEGMDPAAARAALEKVAHLEATVGKVEELQAALDREQQARQADRFKLAVGSEYVDGGGQKELIEFIVQKAEAKGYRLMDDGQVAHPDGTPISTWLAGLGGWAWRPSRGGGATTASQTPKGDTPAVNGHDPAEFGKNIEAIAAGKVRVR